MIHLREKKYCYLEEINEGIFKAFPLNVNGAEKKVLDVGCGFAALSEAIRKKGYIVWGIESEKDVALKADSRIDKVINADLTDLPAIRNEISGQEFDYLVFSDVLEHLYDPFSILKEYLSFLKTGGALLVSVPNIAVWLIRFKLLWGRFDYSDTGVLDRTHIRFFTFKSAKQIVRESGCSISKTDYTPFMVRAFLPFIKNVLAADNKASRENKKVLIDSRLYKLYMKLVYPLEYFLGYLFKPFFAFRIIIIGKKI